VAQDKMSAAEIKYCPRCATPTIQKRIAGKDRPACPNCNWVFFPDPKVSAAVIVNQNNRILLVKRAYGPHAGKWALPAGFVDSYEDPEDAAKRECLEETGLIVKITGLVAVLSGREHPRGADIMITYCALVEGGKLQAGDDAAEAAFFSLTDLPPLAFRTTHEAVRAWAEKEPCKFDLSSPE
jgi:ADP-ribose pyrophosphatase YjhB (NUDIX family)